MSGPKIWEREIRSTGTSRLLDLLTCTTGSHYTRYGRRNRFNTNDITNAFSLYLEMSLPL